MVRVNMSLQPDTHEEARRVVEERGLSLSRTVNRFLDQWIAAGSPTLFTIAPKTTERNDEDGNADAA